MTEKRFKAIINNIDGSSSLLDKTTGEKITSILALEDKINELNDENNLLKKHIGNLEHTRDYCSEYCEELEKENEYLKFEINKVREKYKELWMSL